MLEERVAGDITSRYVWSPVYIDAMVLRDRDTNGDGSLDERLRVQQDANWNVTALVDGGGAVVERYAYDPYGVQSVYDASWSSIGSSAYSWSSGFQGTFFDSTAGLNAVRERWYSPTLGRPIQTDPLRFAEDVNFYRWEQGNPTRYTDPFGLGVRIRRADGTYVQTRPEDVKALLEWYWGGARDPFGPDIVVISGGYRDMSRNRCTGGYGLGPIPVTGCPSVVDRRIWAVSTEDKATAFSIGWHSTCATLNSLVPCGSSDATFRTAIDKWNLPEVVRLMKERGQLSDGTRITFFEIAGHARGAGNLIPHSHIDSASPDYNSPAAKATRDAIKEISSKMSSNAEIRLNACFLGGNPAYMQLLAAAFQRKVSGNTGTVFITGAGQWNITDASGAGMSGDGRWGAFPWPARLYVDLFGGRK